MVIFVKIGKIIIFKKNIFNFFLGYFRGAENYGKRMANDSKTLLSFYSKRIAKIYSKTLAKLMTFLQKQFPTPN